jgi:CheY-like chemotaxis protein
LANTVVAPVLIFLAEDELLVRRVVVAALEEAGFSVLQATSGDDALAMLEKAEAALIRAVVTDVDLNTAPTPSA